MNVGVEKAAAARTGVSVEEWRARRTAGLKWCKPCGDWHPLEEFPRNPRTMDGRGFRCLASQRKPARALLLDEGGDTLKIPLRARDGAVRAYALIDRQDVDVASRPWYLSQTGYAVRHRVFLHRALLRLGAEDGRQVDHINGDPLDNRRENLRIVTAAQNSQNLKAFGKTSRYRGVSWNAAQGAWKARVTVNKREHFLGYFDDEAPAATAVRDARRRLMPFANESRHPVAEETTTA